MIPAFRLRRKQVEWVTSGVRPCKVPSLKFRVLRMRWVIPAATKQNSDAVTVTLTSASHMASAAIRATKYSARRAWPSIRWPTIGRNRPPNLIEQWSPAFFSEESSLYKLLPQEHGIHLYAGLGTVESRSTACIFTSDPEKKCEKLWLSLASATAVRNYDFQPFLTMTWQCHVYL